MNIRTLFPAVSLLLVWPVIGAAGGSLTAEDIAKIKRVHSKYEEAWLKGDADGVRALFQRTVCCYHHTEIRRVSGKKD